MNPVATSLPSQIGTNAPTIGGRPMTLPEVSKPPTMYPSAEMNNLGGTVNNANSNGGNNVNGVQDINAVRNAYSQGISGQGAFAGRNIMAAGGMLPPQQGNPLNPTHNTSGLSQPRSNHNVQGMMSGNMDPKVHPHHAMDMHASGSGVDQSNNSAMNVAKVNDPNNPGFGMGENHAGDKSAGMSSAMMNPQSQPSRLEMMPNFGGGDSIFDNGSGVANGEVGGANSGFLFDDGEDLAAATAAGPDLEF